MSLIQKIIGPIGYRKVEFKGISPWAKSQCRHYQKYKIYGWKYFTGKQFSYAVYFHGNGDFTVYSK
jgi:hypothetical protein